MVDTADLSLNISREMLQHDRHLKAIAQSLEKKIKSELLKMQKVKEAELARRMDTTPQAFNQRMKTGKFKYEELEQMAQAMGAELVVNFRFPDGTEV